MSEKNPINEISDSVKGIDGSLKQIVDIMKPKPKKPDKLAIVLWLGVGALSLYALYYLYTIFQRLVY